MGRSKLPPAVLEFFKKQGAKGGKIGGSKGGKRSAEMLTPEARSERARIAAKASAAVRAGKKKKKSE
jgi:hypothetical protein